jgi:RecA-family ATPase
MNVQFASRPSVGGWLVRADRVTAAEPAAPPHPADASEPVTAVELIRDAVLHGDAITKLPALQPLVEGWLDLNSLALLYGRAGSGKSFVATDLGLSVATGSWWHGHPVDTSGVEVLYVVAEGAAGTVKRLDAWKHLNRHPAEIHRMHWLPQPVSFLDVTASAALAQVAGELNAKLVIIDTLARAMPGGDENGARDMSLAITAADRIRNATGACVLLVHHTGKDQSAGARGHSSLLGAVNTELELKSTDGLITITNTKQKDHAEQQPLRLALVPIPQHDSAAIGRATQHPDPTAGLTAKALDTLASLRSIAIDGGVPATQWQRVTHSDHGIAESTFYKHRTALLEARLVHQQGEGRTARYTPLTSKNTQ